MLTKDIQLKAIHRVRLFLVIACVLTGWLAGVNVDRYIVRAPAWSKMDIHFWAEYTRHTYLSNGFWLYQFEAGCSFILFLVSVFLITRNRLNFVSWPVYLATLFSVIGIVITFYTAPLMFSVPDLGNDAELLQNAFDRVHYLGAYRAVAQVLGFAACIWAIGRCNVIKYVRV